jgi:hypothetical protein
MDYLVGREAVLESLDKELLIQNNNIKGTFFKKYNDINYKFILNDKAGWSKKGGLKNLCNILGIQHTTKNTLDNYKSFMEKCFETQELFDTFVKYAMDDVYCLSQTTRRMTSLINTISTDILKIPEENNFETDTIPSTIGSIVAKMFENYITKELSHGGTTDSTKGKKYRDLFKKIMKNISVHPTIQKESERMNPFNKVSVSDFLNGCSVKSVGYLHSMSTGNRNCLVQGGRTYNEKWWDFQAENVVDIDLQSCYATALKKFVYPVGLPTIEASTTLKDCLSLKDFLKRNESELVDNLYTITISGNLTFDQTLLYSKLTNFKKLSKRISKLILKEECIEDISGEFVVLSRELQNTILTSDILKTLRNVCSSNEIMEIMNCKVITAAFYKKSDFIENQLEWIEYMDVNINSTDYKYNVKSQSVVDTRPRKWTSVKLNRFFEPLIEKRRDIKKDIKDLFSKECSEQEIQQIEEWKALEAIIKLICNTVYGIIASPYFPIGNTVLANNITAKARNSIWLFSRCLNGFQTITDGFQYQPDKIIRFKSTRKDLYKPGLKVLSDLRLLEKHRCIEISSLQQIDIYAKEHIKSFLSYYGLEMDYEVEHKLEHTASKIFRLNSLDLPYKNEKEFKRRHSIKNNVDYGPSLKSKTFQEVFQQRNSDSLELQKEMN